MTSTTYSKAQLDIFLGGKVDGLTLTELVQDILGATIKAGVGVTLSYDDAANSFTINAVGGGSGTTDAEVVRDTIGSALVGGANVQVLVNDGADTLTISVTGLATVATSGAYSDLIGKPDLTTKVDVLTPTAVKTTAYTATVGDIVPADATTAGFAVTLPTAPADRSRITVKKIDTSVNVVTITLGGSDVFNKAGGSTSVTLSVTNQAATFQYTASSAIWYLVGSDLPLSQLDVRYATTAALVNKADLVGGKVPVSQLPSGSGTGTGIDPTDTGFDLVLLLGQSNMSGRGGSYNTVTDPADDRVWQWGASGTNSGTMALASEPLLMHDSASGIGPGLVFARWYASSVPTNRRVLLIPAAHGGTPLSSNTSPLSWRRGVAGNLYAQAVAQTQAALAGAGGASRVAAVLWLQGETDGDGSTAGTAYQTDFDALISGLRTDLGASTLPFIIGQMVPRFLSTGTRSDINVVQAATPSRLTYVRFAAGPVGLDNNDGNHYNAPGQRLLGRSMFDAYRRVLTASADPALPSAVPTQATALAAPVASGQTTVTWTASTGTGVSYYVEQSASGGAYSVVGTTTATSLLITGLTNGTAYTYRVTAINARGPASGTAPTVTVTPSASSDTTAPSTPTNLVAGTPNSSSVPLTWTASTDNVGVTGYRIYRGGTQVGTSATNSYTDTGLSASTAYTYTVAAYDAAGNLSAQSSSASATTTAATDTTAPTVPTNLTVGTVTATTVPLTWTASTDNVGVTGYRVYRGGTQVGTPTTTSFTDTGLTAGTVYTYTVAAVDAAGNVSTQSSSVTATTTASGGATIASDDFARADSTSGLGTTTVGAKPWTNVSGVWGITSQTAYCVTSIAIAAVDAGVADKSTQMTITAGATAGERTGIVFRVIDSQNYWLFQNRSTGWKLLKVVANTTTASVLPDVSTPTPADGVVMKVVQSGSSIVCSANGTTVFSLTDTDLQSATKVGLFSPQSAGTARVDNFIISA